MPHHVLIVEDSEQCAVTLEIALQGIGDDVTVSRFRSGLEALRFLEAGDGASVGALITDLQMPSMDGFELIRRVRRNVRYARLPILVLSGDSDPRTPERTRELGANAFFSKPFSPSQVRKKLEALLNVSA